MLTSITHRVTGVGLCLGLIVLAWWLVAVSNGPEGWDSFFAIMGSPLGVLILFGFTWALAFHMLNGLRHLAWDLGYGFSKVEGSRNSILVIAGSLIVAVGVFALIWTGHGGYLQ